MWWGAKCRRQQVPDQRYLLFQGDEKEQNNQNPELKMKKKPGQNQKTVGQQGQEKPVGSNKDEGKDDTINTY